MVGSACGAARNAGSDATHAPDIAEMLELARNVIEHSTE
jgi:hypothetical protein